MALYTGDLLTLVLYQIKQASMYTFTTKSMSCCRLEVFKRGK